jgi:hypothetical protein
MPEGQQPYNYAHFLIDMSVVLEKANKEDHVYLVSRRLSEMLSDLSTDDESFAENLRKALGHIMYERHARAERIRLFQEMVELVKDDPTLGGMFNDEGSEDN